jgi:hypothetical protein
MREALVSFHDSSTRIIEKFQNMPAPGCQAETEHAIPSLAGSIGTAWSISDFLIENGADHLSAFVKLTASPVETLAASTCVRSMLESCAIAAWVLDPTIDAVRRTSRVFAVRYEGLEQQAKFVRTSGSAPGEVKKVENRIDDVERSAISLGYALVTNGKGKRIGIAEKLPSTTDMIALNLGKEKMYRLLSAVTHGHGWAISQLGFSPADPTLTFGQSSFSTAEKAVNIPLIALLGLSVMNALARPLWNRCRYFGWNALEMEELFEQVADKLDKAGARRFWRTN